MILPYHKKLVVAGCSFTEGEGLENPSLESWPALLANRLNLKCVNLGQRGAGNEFITNTIIDYILENNTEECFFILAYSDYLRVDFCNSIDKTVVHLTPSSKKYPGFRNIFYSQFADRDYFFKKFMRQIMKTQAWFKIKNIDYMMINGMTMFNDQLIKKENLKFCNQIDTNRYKNLQGHNFLDIIGNDGKLPDGHPNKLGHQRIAENVYKWIFSETVKEK